jgi:alpha-beta hydrolase superfamily lysophospholipase
VSSDATVDYQMAPILVARFVGAYLVVFALVILAGTLVVAVAGVSPDLLVVLLGVGLLGLLWLAWWLRNRVALVRLTATGYRVRMVRGAGVTEARWSEVEDAVATQPQGVECVVLRLKDGRATTIPVALLAADKDVFARDVRDHLQATAR